MCAAWELGLTVTGATIVPDPDQGYLGRVLCPIEDRVRYATWVDEDGYLYCHLVVQFAGPAASEKYTGVPTTDQVIRIELDTGGPGNDYIKAADLILSLGGPDESGQAEVGDRALRYAANLIHWRWSRVERVAGALIENETLDEASCREVLEEVFRS
jgi:hypothetical protein